MESHMGGVFIGHAQRGIYHFHPPSRTQAQSHGPDWRQVKAEKC